MRRSCFIRRLDAKGSHHLKVNNEKLYCFDFSASAAINQWTRNYSRCCCFFDLSHFLFKSYLSEKNSSRPGTESGSLSAPVNHSTN